MYFIPFSQLNERDMYFVEHTPDPNAKDPLDALIEHEEELGIPIVEWAKHEDEQLLF